ncbi:MAG TPA: NAD-dependent epimerase/dehydratase family protein [Niastella sp.]|nr:NAD-dependent epimerase/dehydratase family protein [Niastella sp.]
MQLTPNQTERITTSSFLVTGGAGFIGSHIAEFLLSAGAQKVRVLDNMATGHFRNIAPFVNHPRFEYINGDIRDIITCNAACKGIDYVLHHAASGSVPESIHDPITTNSINASGFLNMLVASQQAHVKRFIFASRASIFTGDRQSPHADGLSDNGSSPYAVSEYINELYADVFTKLHGMETIGLRYSNVFGQRHDLKSDYAAVIPRFVMQLIKHQSPVIEMDDEYSHDFIYIENVVMANMLAITTTEPKAVNQVYNITFEERTSLNQLAKYLRELLSSFDERIARVKIPNAFTQKHNGHRVAYIQKSKKLLGYHPAYSLRTGLLKCASWYWTYLPRFAEEKTLLKKQPGQYVTIASV